MPKIFPTAYGYGTDENVGGRGGTVMEVNTTSDGTGAGTMRAAVAAASSGPVHIVPTVAGIQTLASDLIMSNPYITYHGHLAPGGGYMFKGRSVEINTHDVCLRYLRSLAGSIYTAQTNALMIIGANDKYNITLDHCTGAWSSDQSMDSYGKWWNITFQWCLITEGRLTTGAGATAAGYGSLIGRPISYAGLVQTISLHHNVWAKNKARNPAVVMYLSSAGSWFVPQYRCDFRNNLIYRWNGNNKTSFGRNFNTLSAWNAFVAANSETATVGEVNVVGNHWIKGPEGSAEQDAFSVFKNVKVYALNNLGPAALTVPVDGFDIKVTFGPVLYQGHTPAVNPLLHGNYTNTEFIAASPYSTPFVETHDATEIKALLTSQAGATLPAKDAMWTRVMNDVINGTPASNTFTDHGEGDYPTLASGTYPTHSKPDLIPDAWKTENGLSTSVDYTGVLAPDGYDWLEKYSHEVAGDTAPPLTELQVLDAETTPKLGWALVGTPTRNRVYVQWAGTKRWWEAPTDDTLGVNSDGSGRFNEIAESPIVLPAATALKFSIQQFDGGGALETETSQIDWTTS